MFLPSFAASAWTALDVMAVDALWSGQCTIRMEAGVRMADGFGLRIPFSCIRRLGSYDVTFLGGGVHLEYRPFENGLFVSFGVFEGGWFLGADRPQESGCLLNEMAFGYTWRFPSHWFVEPTIRIRDPSGVFATEQNRMEEAFGSYPMVRLSVLVGWESPASFLSTEPRRKRDGDGGGGDKR
ncbi:MAG: hypothetical protein WCQ66_00910 [Sphaerochaetaceae bacterium]|jgi:hypothetical protein